ncbi:hypothetical protein PR048_026740 [Dryococelus australis]|uniref:HTH psq-type domain-containing protein n=1 Tax=Dryococelus australis TaxID=614101 RepID=A0ABQ9GM67_9NEOP|nr:hypothetical protein PR048_026740 [Dryococelus australis]
MARPIKVMRTLDEQLKISKVVGRNPCEKQGDAARHLGLPVSTLCIILSKEEICLQAHKCRSTNEKRKSGRE